MKSPRISIITCLFNPNFAVWEQSLASVSNQDYPQDKIDRIVMDGGSEKRYIDLAKLYGCTVISRPDLQSEPLIRMKLAVEAAKGDIILFLEPDNILPDTGWLTKSVEVFKDPDIVGAFSIHHTYLPGMPALTRYTSLIGINDPTVYYLGKSEKMPKFENRYTKGILLGEYPSYRKVQFIRETLPVIGDNGHMVRRADIQKVSRTMPSFLHTDAFMILLENGCDTYAVLNNAVVHYTGSDIGDFFFKRLRYKRWNYDSMKGKRKYNVFDPESPTDRRNLIKFVVYSLTVLPTLAFAVRGFASIPDPAWFLHPYLCLLSVLSYGGSELARRFRLV